MHPPDRPNAFSEAPAIAFPCRVTG
ncbi:protein of unknown function [Azospirillum baldaniorum]|uniref:Uncharacterized protein n=1 Tax=Azospirillum baldaniorum TaxID=1064539 RepID=A0A9P1JMK7_9PROT|nr:protein of unknown function [Azospirillum baldaniorum]